MNIATPSLDRDAALSPGFDRRPLAVAGDQAPGWLTFLVVLGLAIRFLLAAVTWGSNDANTFNQFGFFITRDGLMNTYRYDSYLNHPPLPALWTVVAWRLTCPLIPDEDGHLHAEQLTSDTPGPWFSAVMKIPALAADCVAAWLIYRIFRNRGTARRAMGVAAIYAWSLCAILVSGYHCNTDPIYAFFCLLCIYFMQDKRMFFWSGVALAAAVNVKLTPILLVPPLVLTLRRGVTPRGSALA